MGVIFFAISNLIFNFGMLSICYLNRVANRVTNNAIATQLSFNLTLLPF
jgi:hypothetical protein